MPAPLSSLSVKRPIRLILSDFDGTFTNHGNKVVEANVRGFTLAQQLGILIGFATGRGRLSAVQGLGEENLKLMDYNGCPGVYCNGSVVFGVSESDRIACTPVSPDLQKRLFDALKARDMLRFTVGLTEADSYCIEYNTWSLICHDSFAEAKPILLENESRFYSHCFNKVMVWQPNSTLLALRKELEQELGDAVEFTMPYADLLELCTKGNNKGCGLKQLSRHLGIPIEETLVVGDSENDISMFKQAGVSVAVADAQPEALNAAKFYTVSSDEGPLLHIIETLQQKGLCPSQWEQDRTQIKN
ncbi:uncharacterized protein LOC34621098 [Cyclospora cayetanensis]|uniref:Uncharacterized protein LOC34621098 n=2 Tax=Cyclospora cayetanensis TaxID=88456 RepID=A0A6P5WET4_9EIME|nr:uncharacterized protein LOC34621098 [Cyclospora cayetanensis]OEH74681.1 phosphatase related protein [Cyclospora cayetanensis]